MGFNGGTGAVGKRWVSGRIDEKSDWFVGSGGTKERCGALCAGSKAGV